LQSGLEGYDTCPYLLESLGQVRRLSQHELTQERCSKRGTSCPTSSESTTYLSDTVSTHCETSDGLLVVDTWAGVTATGPRVLRSRSHPESWTSEETEEKDKGMLTESFTIPVIDEFLDLDSCSSRSSAYSIVTLQRPSRDATTTSDQALRYHIRGVEERQKRTRWTFWTLRPLHSGTQLPSRCGYHGGCEGLGRSDQERGNHERGWRRRYNEERTTTYTTSKKRIQQ